jgi:hypothetical protein
MAKRTCSIDGCEREAIARGWCVLHWGRWRRNGDPLAPVKRKAADGEPLAWLVALVAETVREGCRDWPFGVDHSCDDRAMLGRRKAGHIALELDGRPRPPAPGNNMLHSCDRPICVAPWHLRWGTIAENRADCVGRNRHVVIVGEASRHHKLTTAQALDIRDSTERIADMARKYDISYQSAWMIRSGRAWKHLK